MKNKTLVQSLAHALGVFVYVSLVAWLMSNGEKIFGNTDPETIWMPIAMLMLFVVSAAITGSLVLARPILLYLDGKKSEAVRFLVYTIGWLFVLIIIAFTIVVTTL